jgi:cell division cycle 2-like protein
MAELLAGGAPLFNADTEEGLLKQTIDLRDDIVTMGVEAFDDMLDELSVAGRELLASLLDFDSWERPAAADALKHRWFAEEDVKPESLGVRHDS